MPKKKNPFADLMTEDEVWTELEKFDKKLDKHGLQDEAYFQGFKDALIMTTLNPEDGLYCSSPFKFARSAYRIHQGNEPLLEVLRAFEELAKEFGGDDHDA